MRWRTLLPVLSVLFLTVLGIYPVVINRTSGYEAKIDAAIDRHSTRPHADAVSNARFVETVRQLERNQTLILELLRKGE